MGAANGGREFRLSGHKCPFRLLYLELAVLVGHEPPSAPEPAEPDKKEADDA